MSYLVIENFQGGLDTRKARLAAPAGTLTEGLDGHITPGGEFEKRKAFVALVNPNGSETDSLYPGTFGLQPVASGLLVFGSGDLSSAQWPADADGVAVAYQRLQHPAVLAGETYSAGSHAMTAIIHSDAYGGKAFVVAQFADGKRFSYYDGQPVYDFIDGLVLDGRNTTAKIAADIGAIINRTNRFSATVSGSVTTVTGPVGQTYQSTANKNSNAGTLALVKTSDPTSPVAANAATASFRIMAGTNVPGTNKITQVEVNGVVVTNGAVDWTASNEVTAALIASSINTKASTPEYTAQANGAVVTITASAEGVTPNGYVVKVTSAGNVCCGDAAFQFVGAQFTVDSININGTNRLTGAIGYPGTFTTLSAAVAEAATQINSQTGTHGYLACAIGPVLFISKAVTRSDDVQEDIFIVLSSVDGGGGVTQINGGIASIPAVVPVATGGALTTVGSPSLGGKVATLSATATGGVGPYSYEWFVTPDFSKLSSAPIITNGNTAVATLNFFNVFQANGTVVGTAYCRVTDSIGSIKNSNVIQLVVGSSK